MTIQPQPFGNQRVRTQTVEVADGVFAYLQQDGSWYLNNAGFVPDTRLSFFIDSAATIKRTNALLAEARRRGVGERVGMIATHHHGDHTNGNATIDPAVLISHAAVPDELRGSFAVPPAGLFTPVEWGEIEVLAPDIVFHERLEMQLGKHNAQILHFGHPAHTLGDAVVYFPDDRLLFAGDLAFSGGTPFALMGSVQGWLASLDGLRSLEVDTVVPGHGDLCTMTVFDDIERYLRFVLHHAEDAYNDGVPPLEAARSIDLGEFDGWHDRERIVGNLHRAIAEVGGAVPGASIDIVAAFGDMVSYNQGPLTCLA